MTQRLAGDQETSRGPDRKVAIRSAFALGTPDARAHRMAPTPPVEADAFPIEMAIVRRLANKARLGQAMMVRSLIPPVRDLGADGEQTRDVIAIDRGALEDG